MLDLLNAILKHVGEEQIDEIISIQSEYPIMGESANSKYGRLDVRVRSRSGRLFNIEVQVTKDYMNERGFFYGSRMTRDEFESGTTYDKMPEVRVITIVDYYAREGSRSIVEPVSLVYENDTKVRATNKFRMLHIQLPVFRKGHKTLESVQGDRFLEWLYLLDKGYKDEREMEVLAGMSEGMMNFAQQYNIAINDPKLKWMYRFEQDALRDKESEISVAVDKAVGKAVDKAVSDTSVEHARKMKGEGLPIDLIARVTGLAAEDIQKLV